MPAEPPDRQSRGALKREIILLMIFLAILRRVLKWLGL